MYSPYFNSATKLNAIQYKFLKNNKKLKSKKDISANPELLNNFFYISLAAYNVITKSAYNEEESISTRINNLTLIMTNLCNLKCKYCYAFGGEISSVIKNRANPIIKSTINIDSAQLAIRTLKPNNVLFFGMGEPTLTFDKIKQIIESCKDLNINYRIDTNGVYLKKREEIIKYFIDNKVKMQISYDGLDELTNKYRGSDKFDTSKEILKTLTEIKKYRHISDIAYVRITACNGIERKFIKVINNLKAMGFNKVRIEPIVISGRAKNFLSAKPNMHALVVNFAKALIFAKKNNFKITSNLLPAIGTNLLSCKTCSYIRGSSITLSLDNKFYACVDPVSELQIGKILNRGKININKTKLYKISKKRDISKFKQCSFCPVKCGGGCTKESYNNYGSFDKAGENRELCNYRKLVLYEYIKNLNYN